MFSRLRVRILSNAYAYSKQCSRVNLYELLAAAIAKHNLAGTSTTLNVGSGGEIDSAIRSAGSNPRSVDIDPTRNPDVVASIEDLHMFGDSTLDGVFCMEVLEHVQNPFSAATEIYRVLKPGGILIGSTPFILGIHDAPYDFFRYTEYGIRHLFKELSEIEITPRNNVFDAAKVIPLRLFAIGTEEEKRQLAFRWPLIRFANWLYSVAGRGISNSDATTGYFFVFSKPPEVA